jgi:hypothetical protein
MAFEPTPALEHNKENYSPFGYPNDVKPDDDYNKSVRFSDFPTITSPVKRAQSIANPQNIPLLEPISSASHVPRQQASSIRFKNAVPEIDMDAYLEHTRSVIEGQREGFEKEKKAFDQERKMWNAERSMLKARIAELEFKLNKSQGSSSSKRRYSNDSTVAPCVDSIRSAYIYFPDSSKTNSTTSSRQPSRETEKITAPIWEGPENTAPVTRVFSNEDQKTVDHMPSISEDEALQSGGDAVSPKTEPAVPIPIEAIDSNLEGIMIKSTALAPSFVARINSGTQSPAHSPSPRPRPADGNLALEMNNLLSPLDEKLKRHAGHTPMNFSTNGASSGGNSSGQPTPRQEKPPAPTSSVCIPLRPSENSDSYFSFTAEGENAVKVDELDVVEEKRRADVRRGTLSQLGPILQSEETQELDEDPELQGPLMLDPSAKLKSSDSFLSLVNAKLQDEIKQHPEVSKDAEQTAALLSPTSGTGSPSKSDTFEKEQTQIEVDDGMPKLKMKRSMNFGSAWGGTFPGRHMS